MKSIVIRGLVLFAISLILYVSFFKWDHWLRTRKGGWELQFLRDDAGTPKLLINQSALNIQNVEIIFEGDTVPTNGIPIVKTFNMLDSNFPFGDLFYNDLTYLPGVLTFNFFGHEIELMPRVLTVNSKQYAWQNTRRLILNPPNKTLKSDTGRERKRNSLL